MYIEPIRKRDMKLKDYNVTRNQYNELKHFCMQYHEKRRELTESYKFYDSVGFNRSRGDSARLTDKQLQRYTSILKDLQMIEETAREADERVYPFILKNVTEGIPYEYMDVPMGRKQFYESRRYFFLLLSRKR